VRHLDDLDARGVEALHHRDDLVLGVLVGDGVRSVAERGVDEPEVAARLDGRGGHAGTPSCDAMASPTRTAAAVMMSRLPA